MGIERKRQDETPGGAGAKQKSAKQTDEEEGTGIPITVHSYSGYKKDEKPRAFELEGSRLTVLSVKKTWQEESAKGRHRKAFFRVHAHNGRTYDIALDEGSGEWTLEPGRETK